MSLSMFLARLIISTTLPQRCMSLECQLGSNILGSTSSSAFSGQTCSMSSVLELIK